MLLRQGTPRQAKWDRQSGTGKMGHANAAKERVQGRVVQVIRIRGYRSHQPNANQNAVKSYLGNVDGGVGGAGVSGWANGVGWSGWASGAVLAESPCSRRAGQCQLPSRLSICAALAQANDLRAGLDRQSAAGQILLIAQVTIGRDQKIESLFFRRGDQLAVGELLPAKLGGAQHFMSGKEAG